jgi:hypothetical protein
VVDDSGDEEVVNMTTPVVGKKTIARAVVDDGATAFALLPSRPARRHPFAPIHHVATGRLTAVC